MSDAREPQRPALQNGDSSHSGRGLRARRLMAYPFSITRDTLYSSYMNVLLAFVPIGIAAGILGWTDALVFFLNFLAVIPLASLIAFSARELSESVEVVLGRLLKATLSNIFEIIVGIIAVRRGQIVIASSSLLGSILFDSLLVLGCSVFFSSYSKESLKFSKILTNIMSSLMMVASVCLIVPTTMSPLLVPSDYVAAAAYDEKNTLILSRSTAIILLALFIVYVYFQLKTHTYLFLFLDPVDDRAFTGIERRDSNINEAERRPTLNLWAASGVLIASTLSIIVCISYLIDTVDGLAQDETVNFSKTFIGLVLIPTAGNIGKCAALVAISRKKGIDFAIRTIINSVLQISLLIIPTLILMGWILGQPMMLNFDIFEAAVFFLAIIVVSYVIQDGRTNYFEGVMLIGTYIIIVAAFYVRP